MGLRVERLSTKLRAKLEAKTGHIGNEVGHGLYGTAYQTADTQRVVKLTEDDVEARSANILMHRPMDEAAKIYGVWELQDSEPTSDGIMAFSPMYAIWLEHLDPLVDDDFRMIALWQRFNGKPELLVKDVKEFLGFWKCKEQISPDRQAWLLGTAKGLEERHIVHRDLHTGNVMRHRGGGLAFFDVGDESKVPAQSIEPLAAMFQSLARRLS